MAKKTVNIGTTANDGTGDPLRDAFDKLNDNFDEVYGNNFVTTARINSDAVDGTKIADDAIDSEHYVDGSIDTAHIADDQVTYAKLAAQFTTRATIPSDDDVDFATASVFYQEMTGDTTYDIENPKVGDVKTLVLEGDGTDRTIAFEMSSSSGTNIFKKMKGSDDFSFTDGDYNLVQMICVDDTADGEQIWYSNSVVAS